MAGRFPFWPRTRSEKTAASPQDQTLSFTVTASWEKNDKNRTQTFRFEKADLVPEGTYTDDVDIVNDQYFDKKTFDSIRYLSAQSWQTVLQQVVKTLEEKQGAPIDKWTLEYKHTDDCLHLDSRYGSLLQGMSFWEDSDAWEGSLGGAPDELEKTFSNYHPWALVDHESEPPASPGQPAKRRGTDLATSPPRSTIRRAQTSGGESRSETVEKDKPGRCSVRVANRVQSELAFVLTAQSSTSPRPKELKRRGEEWPLPLVRPS